MRGMRRTATVAALGALLAVGLQTGTAASALPPDQSNNHGSLRHYTPQPEHGTSFRTAARTRAAEPLANADAKGGVDEGKRGPVASGAPA